MAVILRLGLSFAEVMIEKPGDPEHRKIQRFFLPSEPVRTFLPKILANYPGEEILVSSRYLERILGTRLGGSVLQLTPKGFENWLRLRQPLSAKNYSLVPKRAESLGSQELSVGFEGDLSRHTEKWKELSLSKISLQFFAQEKANEASRVLPSLEGIENLTVFNDQPPKGADEIPYWRRSLLNACLWGSFAELRTDLQTIAGTASVKFIDADGTQFESDPHRMTSHLFSWLRPFANSELKQPMLWLGLEGWFWIHPQHTCDNWKSQWGEVHVPTVKFRAASVQPTQEIRPSRWGLLENQDEERGFEPGPMCLGRSHKPLVSDLLISSCEKFRWRQQAGVDRFENAFKTQLKSIDHSGLTVEIGRKKILQHLARKIKFEAQLETQKYGDNHSVTIGGYWAETMAPYLGLKMTPNWDDSKELGGLL